MNYQTSIIAIIIIIIAVLTGFTLKAFPDKDEKGPKTIVLESVFQSNWQHIHFNTPHIHFLPIATQCKE